MGGGADDSSSALRDVTFGSLAGMAAKVFEHPFDLVKVRLQSQPTDRPLSFTGPLDCFKQTYVREGWRGLYRGISAPLFGAACENAVLFLAYNKFQQLILTVNPGTVTADADGDGLSEKARGKRRELSIPELALSAAGAGATASFVLTPIELIKCRMQVQMLAREGAFESSSATSRPLPSTTPSAQTVPHGARGYATSPSVTQPLRAPAPGLPPPEGPFSLIASTVRTHGIRGLWLGQMGTLFRETGGSSAWFSAYEITSRYFISRRQSLLPSSTADPEYRLVTKADLSIGELMASGAVAGMSYNVILFPADSVKSAMQTSAELNPHKPPPSFWVMAGKIWKSRGLRGMYAGCGLTVARAAPSSAMIFVIYETLQKNLGWVFD